MLFDVLDNLEWYRALHPQMQGIIDIMDRSLPYDDLPGTYTVQGITYKVMTYTTSEHAVLQTAEEAQLHIILEGEELFSLQQEGKVCVVSQITTGMFVLVRAGETYSHQQNRNSAVAVKKVVFTLPGLGA